MTDTVNPLREFFDRYGPPAGEAGPVLFVKEILGATPLDWQEDILRAYGRRERRIAVRSAHGVGKTTVVAWLIIYQLCCLYRQKSVATAPSASQLHGALVPEVKTWLQQLPEPIRHLFIVKAEGIYFAPDPAGSFFEARTARADAPEAIQGVHSDWVLLVIDEGSGVPDAVFEAGIGSMSGKNATTIMLGNPTRSSGFFFDAFHRAKHLWRTYHVSGMKATGEWYSPLVEEDFIQQVRDTYGEDSNAFRVRVLGEFPRADDDAIIPYELAAEAQLRQIEVPAFGPRIWGLDVARFGDDSSVLLERTNIGVSFIETWAGMDTMQTAARVKHRWDNTPPDRRPAEVLVDVIGIGAGVVDRLTQLGLPVRGINVAETASMNEQYHNLRTELLFKVRDWLASKTCKLPDGKLADMLIGELTAIKYGYSGKGKLLAVPKEETKKIIRRSPDIADALALTFASEPATLIHGAQDGFGWGTVSWNEPLRRGRSVLV